MSKGIAIVNDPSGRPVFVTRRNAARMLEFGIAETVPGGLAYTPGKWDDQERRLAKLKRRRQQTVFGYDEAYFPPTVEAIEHIPVQRPRLALTDTTKVPVRRVSAGRTGPVRVIVHGGLTI